MHVPEAHVVRLMEAATPANLYRVVAVAGGAVMFSTQLGRALKSCGSPSPKTVVGDTEQPDKMNDVCAPVVPSVNVIGWVTSATTVTEAGAEITVKGA